MTTKLLLTVIGIGLLYLAGCKDPFEPSVHFSNPSLLVVEGYLNSSGPTNIHLSRTVPLNNSTTLNPELNANVRVEGSNGSSFSLTANVDGTYSIASMALHSNEKYRLYIKTANNKEYISDYVAYKVTPKIDEFTWDKKPNGVQILVSTHDLQNQTQYYRWEFEETWEFNSVDRSLFEWSEREGKVVRRDPFVNIYTCWKTAPSSRVLLGSTARLQEDVISNYPLTFVPDTSWKLSVRYSILVKQYALTKEASEYWQQLAKNTEQLGSIFDAQPSELRGNIHCLSQPQEPVIGFISAGSIEERRLFINHQEVPDFIYRQENCSIDTVSVIPDVPEELTFQSYFSNGRLTPIRNISGKYTYAFKECVDCRIRGSNVKPNFW